MECHPVVDLLPGRTSVSLSAWLVEHPGVEAIATGRSTEYTQGASQGSPESVQVADGKAPLAEGPAAPGALPAWRARAPARAAGATRAAGAGFDAWLEATATSTIRALRTFARGIQADYAAVRAALEPPWSNTQCEGQVTRLKFLKRQIYGRANFGLLRHRVLLTT